MAWRRTSPVKKVCSRADSCRATLFSRWNWSSAKTRRKMSWVSMCCNNISRTSASDTAGADAAAAQFEELGDAFAVVGIAFLGLSHRLAEVFENGGQVGLELMLRLPELLDLGQFVAEEAGDETVQVGGPGHVHPHGLFPVLDQDGSPGVLEDDVVLWVAPVELGLDFVVQVVVGVLGFPVAAGHAQGVLDGSVGDSARAGQLRHQRQPLRWSLQ